MTEVVRKFYQNVLADESVNGFFSSTDMSVLAKSQATFMIQAFGGPKVYKGNSDMAAVHKGMNISD